MSHACTPKPYLTSCCLVSGLEQASKSRNPACPHTLHAINHRPDSEHLPCLSASQPRQKGGSKPLGARQDIPAPTRINLPSVSGNKDAQKTPMASLTIIPTERTHNDGAGEETKSNTSTGQRQADGIGNHHRMLPRGGMIGVGRHARRWGNQSRPWRRAVEIVGGHCDAKSMDGFGKRQW